ncbi:MAG: isocitrate/isopropylmalate dehydrogenase family protein [Planctomycetes bacterium]|nr:isocitrate/isopropylmalate dehydrogenase family protein [Planctomycetota bacterium]
MSFRIGLVPGDGIGVEVVAAARPLLDRLLPGAELLERQLGFGRWQRDGVAFDQEDLDLLAGCDAILLGAVGSPSGPAPGYASPVVALRRHLGLFATVRPARLPEAGVDLVVLRETSEGLYSGLEHSDGERAECRRVVTRAGCERFLRFCRGWVESRGRRRVTLVHKANVLRETCGLFRQVALEVFAGAAFAVDEMLVDSAAYRLARDPRAFDVIVTTNLFGDILSDLAAAFAGGLGLAASASLGVDQALFEPVHGSAPDIAGRGLANPLATFRALEFLLERLERPREAAALGAALDRVLVAGPATPDRGGRATTAEVGAAVLAAIEDIEVESISVPVTPRNLIHGEEE